MALHITDDNHVSQFPIPCRLCHVMAAQPFVKDYLAALPAPALTKIESVRRALIYAQHPTALTWGVYFEIRLDSWAPVHICRHRRDIEPLACSRKLFVLFVRIQHAIRRISTS